MTDPTPLHPVDRAFEEAERFVPSDRGDGGDGDRGPAPDDEPGLPDDVPVIPVGKRDNFYFVIDSSGQLRVVKDAEMSRSKILSLFDRCTWALRKYWPRLKTVEGRDGVTTKVVGVRYEDIQEQIFAACADEARCGIWDPIKFLRGPGAWRGDGGELILHCGMTVWRGAEAADRAEDADGDAAGEARRGESVGRPGRIDRHVYPAAPATLRPAKAAQQPYQRGGPSRLVLDALSTWNWRRGETDAHLLLGWICCAMVAGAVDWRAMCWVTGERNTGKSTLHKLIAALFDDSVIAVTNTSAAGLWQKIGHSSLPVMVDEMEADADNRRAQGVIELARHAASGGVTLRGGADHQATEFKSQNCFLFSSILVPPLRSQDLSRQAILRLGELDVRAVPPVTDKAHWRRVGRGLLRRMCDGWHRWDATVAAYRQALLASGHDGRGADQWGSLLAAADLALYDAAPDGDTLGIWAERVAPSVDNDAGERDQNDHDRCLEFLASSTAETWRAGLKRPIGSYIAEAAGLALEDIEHPDERAAKAVLATVGLKVFDQDGRRYLAVAKNHQALQAIFRATYWGGSPGASGVWGQALERAPGALRSKANLSFSGVRSRAVLVPITAMLGDDYRPSGPGWSAGWAEPPDGSAS